MWQASFRPVSTGELYSKIVVQIDRFENWGKHDLFYQYPILDVDCNFFILWSYGL